MAITSQYTLKRNTDGSDSTGIIFNVSVSGYDEQTGEYSYTSFPIEGGLPSVDSLEWSYSHHVFKEWNTRSDGSGVSFAVGDYPPYDGDYDYESSSYTSLIYAIWEADPTYYIATDTELTSIADAIRTKGGTSASLEYPTGFVSAIDNIPGSESFIQKVHESTVTVNTTSTTEINVTNMTVNWPTNKWLYICIRDTQVPRNQYFWGSDAFVFADAMERSGATFQYFISYTYAGGSGQAWFVNGSIDKSERVGVYVKYVTGNGVIYIAAKYSPNGAQSKTINSTYKVTVYVCDWPVLSDNPWDALSE